MKWIQKYYIDRLIEKTGGDIDLIKFAKIDKQIDDFEQKFKLVNFMKKDVYKQPPKYYLKNKIKKNTNDIQESLKTELIRMNNTYKDNIYLMDIEHNVLEKEENKHVYNIFHVSILEYKKVNLFDDFIAESDVFFSQSMKPQTYANISPEMKLYLYDVIDDTLNCSEIYTVTETIGDVTISYHNDYFKYLMDHIYDFFMDMYVRDKNAMKLKSLFCQLDYGLCCSDYFNMEEVLYSHGNNEKNRGLICEIIDLIIDMGWTISMGFLNDARLKQFG